MKKQITTIFISSGDRNYEFDWKKEEQEAFKKTWKDGVYKQMYKNGTLKDSQLNVLLSGEGKEETESF